MHAFQNLQPIGTRIEQNGIGPELRDLGRGLSFMTSPLMSTGSLLATGKLPLDYVLGEHGRRCAAWGTGAGNDSRAVWRAFAEPAEFFVWAAAGVCAAWWIKRRRACFARVQVWASAVFSDATECSPSPAAHLRKWQQLKQVALLLAFLRKEWTRHPQLLWPPCYGAFTQVGPDMTSGMGGAFHPRQQQCPGCRAICLT
jgi:hypothetical protein